MSQYSELMGSFLRTGNFPLEANYIFATEEALKEFYSDPINTTTLHRGLLRVVENGGDGQQALYWVVKKQTNDELEFVKLIQNIDIDNIDNQLETLSNQLNKEIQDRKDADTALWGTSDSTNIPDDLNSVMDLANAVTDLRSSIQDLRDSDNNINKQIRALAGTEQTDIVEYLKTLPYQSLTEAANALNKFLNEVDSSTTKINTLVELQNFLDGYTDADSLKSILDKLWNKIEGDVTPSEDFQTLKGIEEFVRTLAQWAKDRTNNLQTEIDKTQVGVGLSGDGSFNPDKETNYLQDSTSVMNALKTLDSLMKEALDGMTISVENNDIVQLAVRKELESWIVSAKLLLSNVYGNELIKKEDGLYMKVTSEYKDGTLTLLVNDKVVSQHILGFSSIVESTSYDPKQEAILITFKLLDGGKQNVTIPVGALIREWTPDNSNLDRVVEIYREEVVDGSDKVSADVRLSTERDNILRKQGNTLYVKGTSDNITHNSQSLDTVIEKIKTEANTTNSNLNSEIERAKASEHRIAKDLESEIQRATDSEEVLTDTISDHISDNNNPHKVTKSQVGLSNVDNTSDINKPVSVAQQNAINQAKQEVRDIIDKYTVNGHKISNNPVLNKIDVGLDKVDNTSDREKPVSDPQQEALDALEKSVCDHTINRHKIVDNPILTKTDIGLDQVDNTSDLDKPISTATQNALDQKAPINSPIFTGIPEVETSPDAEDSSQRIPSTNWVRDRISEIVGESLQQHLTNYQNPHRVTADQVGLGNVNNTSDKDKPISDVTQTALDNLNNQINRVSSEQAGNLNVHLNDYTNPHKVTPEQVGTYSTLDIDSKLLTKADLVGGKIPVTQIPYLPIYWIDVE